MHVTPRQGQILDLAASGFSDKEIAKRLGVSRSTVRTHLENLFKARGLPNRCAAVSAWGARTERPADACPYPQPFPPDFHDCPAYQARQVVSLDLSFRPLGRTLTCRHTFAKALSPDASSWYAACQVGDARARAQWSSTIGVARLRQITVLQQDIAAISEPFLPELWAVKSRQLEARHSQEDTEGLTGELIRLAGRLAAAIRRFLELHRRHLEDLHLPVDACTALMEEALSRFINEPAADIRWQVSDETLDRFPADIRAYLRPPNVDWTLGPPLRPSPYKRQFV
jgi:DNA-binding CsgD family transcriptional regulator